MKYVLILLAIILALLLVVGKPMYEERLDRLKEAEAAAMEEYNEAVKELEETKAELERLRAK